MRASTDAPTTGAPPGATTVPRDGRLSVVRRDPDPDALRAAASRLTAERAAWWHDRLGRCLALLGEDS